VFDRLECQQCHPAPWYTSPRLFDVGMPDENGQREFNPPSLRGVGHRDRYFHDNRAETLADVFRKHHHQVPHDLNKREVEDLAAFLRTL
jgi:cytochrome c peroxidase